MLIAFGALFASALTALRAQSVYTAPYTFTTTGGRTGNVDGAAAAARFRCPSASQSMAAGMSSWPTA
ncbi:MAG: hypothetical protein JNK23_10900 [Opitutaceae bacterium]|nr:hypothetical protein [Opitutaceae bacterium]